MARVNLITNGQAPNAVVLAGESKLDQAYFKYAQLQTGGSYVLP